MKDSTTPGTSHLIFHEKKNIQDALLSFFSKKAVRGTHTIWIKQIQYVSKVADPVFDIKMGEK